jgi:hypothetical protein
MTEKKTTMQALKHEIPSTAKEYEIITLLYKANANSMRYLDLFWFQQYNLH